MPVQNSYSLLTGSQYVVDGNWVTDTKAPEETDSSNISNNVLYLKDVKKQHMHTMSSAAPNSTTAVMAGGVQKEARDQTLSSAAPESSTAQLAGRVSKEEKNNISQIPGAFPETPAVESEDFMAKQAFAEPESEKPVSTMPEEMTSVPKEIPNEGKTALSSYDIEQLKQKEDGTLQYGVNPIPATSGIGNPVQLKPGQQVPDSSNFTQNTIQSTVRTDEQSYLKGDTGPPQLGPVITPEVEGNAKGDMFGIGPVLGTIIPESSLPMGDGPEAGMDPGNNVSSAHPQSTTAMLAAQVPKEPRGVPQIVKESQEKSELDRVAATAAAPDMLQAKKELKREIDDIVPTSSSASEGMAEKVGSANNLDQSSEGVAAGVPPVVKDSITQAHESPEAATNAEAVQEKKAVESEFLKEVKPVDVSGEPAPTANESRKESSISPEPEQSSVNAMKPMEEKQPAMVAPAPIESQQPATIPPSVVAAASPEPSSTITTAPDSRDVSPMSKPIAKAVDAKRSTEANASPATAAATTTTAGATNASASHTVPQSAVVTAAAPSSSKAKDSMDSPTSTSESPATDKKNKRRSIFGRVKEKIKHF